MSHLADDLRSGCGDHQVGGQHVPDEAVLGDLALDPMVRKVRDVHAVESSLQPALSGGLGGWVRRQGRWTRGDRRGDGFTSGFQGSIPDPRPRTGPTRICPSRRGQAERLRDDHEGGARNILDPIATGEHPDPMEQGDMVAQAADVGEMLAVERDDGDVEHPCHCMQGRFEIGDAGIGLEPFDLREDATHEPAVEG